MLACVQVEHEVGKSTLKARSLAEVDDEARTRDLGGTVEVEDAESFADLPVGFSREVELRLLAPGFLHAIAVLVLAYRNRVVGQVRQRLQDLAQTFVSRYGGSFQRLYLGLERASLLSLRRCVAACAPKLRNLFGQLVALRLQRLDPSDGVAAFAVDLSEVAQSGGGLGSSRAQFFFNQGQIGPHKCKIDH